MRKFFNLNINGVWFYTFFTIFLAMIIGVFFLNPIWSNYSPPFQIIRIYPAITAPVDGPFYLMNAEIGYRWDPNDFLSIWFHPLLSFLVSVMPKILQSKIWFWILSILAAIVSIFLLIEISKVYNKNNVVSPYLIPFILLIPGGLSIATGNPEIPTLLFTSLLLLSILIYQKWWLTITFAVLGILTKPNALYMVPILSVYFFSGLLSKENKLWEQSLLGIISILVGWSAWILIVDWHVGEIGSYWGAREIANNFVAGNPTKFFLSLVNSFVNTGNLRDQIRYSSALLIPLLNIWFISIVPFSKETHRIAISVGNISMLFIAILFGNPNKIIVYTTTIPGYFYVYLMMFSNLLNINWIRKPLNKFVIAPIFILFCASMLLIYVLGTPLGWYY